MIDAIKDQHRRPRGLRRYLSYIDSDVFRYLSSRNAGLVGQKSQKLGNKLIKSCLVKTLEVLSVQVVRRIIVPKHGYVIFYSPP